MVKIRKVSNTKIQINSPDIEYLKDVKDHFTSKVEGYYHMPKFKSGMWNGSVSLFSDRNKTLPYGLLVDWLKFHKKNYPDVPYEVDPKVTDLFKGHTFPPKYDLSLYPYDFQKDCIEEALKHPRGIMRVATASGKSLIISYIIKTLLENEAVERCLIIVPTIGLVEQFCGDMKEYGVKFNIGRVYEKYKEFDKTIVISTWQTLSRNHDKLNLYDGVIVDEAHGAKSHEISKILKKCKKAIYRLGFTGTLPTSKLDLWNVKSYLGPLLREYSSGELAEKGYISKCNIKLIHIQYNDEYDGMYDDIKDSIFTNDFRLRLMGKLAESMDHNILILVGKVEKEGEYLENFFREETSKDVMFLSGRDDVDTREYWRKKCMKRKDIILIATYGIFQLGINIPNLKYIILAAPFKSKIRVLQSIGRALRKHSDKVNGAIIFDISDDVRYLGEHSLKRLRYYDKEKFSVEEYLFKEGGIFNLSLIN